MEINVKKRLIMLFVYSIHYSLVGLNKLIGLLGVRAFVGKAVVIAGRALVYSLYKVGAKLVVEGYENVPKKGPAIIACNHQSYTDAPLIGTFGPRSIVHTSKIENFHVPILGPLLELTGVVPLAKRGGEGALSAVENILRAGGIIAIFPEGTIPGGRAVARSSIERETGLLRGRTGAVRLALSTGSVIVPCGLSGTSNALPPEAVPNRKMRPMLRFGKRIRVKFGRPISYERCDPDRVPREHIKELTNRMMKEISRLVDFSLSFPPYSVPLSDEDYKGIIEFEREWGVGPARNKNFVKARRGHGGRTP
jgi:1-acyl-sn-glycerol-3-phosphate acyltransferase